MKKITFVGLIIAIGIAMSCNTKPSGECCTNPNCCINDNLLQATLWFQQSGEMQALYYQAYNTAKYALDDYLKQNKSNRKMAVVVDVDETVLDNSRFEGYLIQHDSTFSPRLWKQWSDSAIATPLPGALEFLKYAETKGVEVFYISNRKTNEIPATLKNLSRFGFPCADERHMVFKTDKNSTKEPRRVQVSKDYDIVMLCGDNLGDFAAAFDNREDSPRIDSVQKYKDLFGKRFIVLPNPMYGDWEKYLFGKEKLTDKQRDSIRRAKIVGY